MACGAEPGAAKAAGLPQLQDVSARRKARRPTAPPDGDGDGEFEAFEDVTARLLRIPESELSEELKENGEWPRASSV